MKAKKQYRIGARMIDFKWMDEDWGNDGERYGQSENNPPLIKIAVNSDDSMKTFLHEVIHEISFQCSLKLEEQAVRALAYFIVAFCRDNEVDLRENMELETTKWIKNEI